MTIVWLETLIKSLIIGAAATWAAQLLTFQINYLKAKQKVLFIILVLLPLTLPPLLPAYSYSAFSFNFQTQAFYNEILYCLIIAFKVIPIGVILLLLIPTSTSKSATFCEQLLTQNIFSKIYQKSHLLAVFFLVSLFAFHDYEIASLMRIKHWTVVLFNAHAGGLVMNLNGSFRMILLPLITSMALTISSFYFLKKCNGTKSYTSRKNHASLFIVAFSLICLLIIPLITISSNSLNGFKDILSGNWMQAEIVNSLALTSVTTICCLMISFGVLQFKKTLLLSTFPGLFGSLILGLLFISLFNLPGLNSVKQTVIPLCLALITYGLPFSILICIALKNFIPAQRTAITLLNKKSQRIIKWDTIHLSSILATLPLFCFLWFDLTLSSMLAPASVTTLFPRLYNLMHYSENEKLSATVILTTLIPFVIYLFLYAVCKTRVYLLSRSSIK